MNFEAKISILIPLRNESSNVSELLKSVDEQENLKSFEIITLNDGSTDNTRDLIANYKFSSPSKAMEGNSLPDGWLGKNYACHQLAMVSDAKFLVFIDADVRLSRSAICDAINTLVVNDWDYISPYPKQIAHTPLELLIQPLLQWSWFATVPLSIAQKFRIPAMAVANGQFLIVKRTSYLTAGGHEKIKNEVIDDIELARLLLRSGFKGGVAEGSSIAECHMYQSATELISGYRKSLWRAFGSPIGSLVAISLLSLSSIVPFVYAISGSLVGWIGFIAIVISRFIAAFRTKSRWETALLHPLSIVILIALICWSWVGKSRGDLKWRDRKV